jgi:hypothetical protein
MVVMRSWKPAEQECGYCRWVLPAFVWTRARPFDDGQIKIIFEDGEWLGVADVSRLDDGSRFLSPEEIESVRAEFGLDRYCS